MPICRSADWHIKIQPFIIHNRWYSQVYRCEKLYTYSDIKVLQRFNEKRGGLLALDSLPVGAKQDERMLDDVDAYLKYVTMELLSFDSNYHLLEEEVVTKYLDEEMKDMPSCNLSLEKGVAGVGLSILKVLQA